MKVTALHSIKSGGKFYAPGETLEVSKDDVADLRAADAITGGTDDVPTAAEVLALAFAEGVHFKKVEAAAKKLLGDKFKSGWKKPDIIGAVALELTDDELKAFLAGNGVTVTTETREQLIELVMSA